MTSINLRVLSITPKMKRARRHFLFAASVSVNVLLLALILVVVVAAQRSADPEIPRVCPLGSTLKWATGHPEDDETELLDVGCVDDSGRRNGPALRFVSGELFSFASFDHGVLDGGGVIWGPDDIVQMVMHNSHGRPSGTTVVFGPEGKLDMIIALDPDSGRATDYTWYPGGGQRSLFHATIDADTGRPTTILVGSYWIRDEEGALLVEGQFEDGVRTGGWRCRRRSIEAFETTTFPGGDETRRVVDCLENVFESTEGSRNQVAASEASDH